MKYFNKADRGNLDRVQCYIRELITYYFDGYVIRFPDIRITKNYHGVTGYFGAIKARGEILLSASAEISDADYHNDILHLLIHCWQYQQYRYHDNADALDKSWDNIRHKSKDIGKHTPYHSTHFHIMARKLNDHKEVNVQSHLISDHYIPRYIVEFQTDRHGSHIFKTPHPPSRLQLTNALIALQYQSQYPVTDVLVTESHQHGFEEAVYLPKDGCITVSNTSNRHTMPSATSNHDRYAMLLAGSPASCFSESATNLIEGIPNGHTIAMLVSESTVLFTDAVNYPVIQRYVTNHASKAKGTIKEVSIHITSSYKAHYYYTSILNEEAKLSRKYYHARGNDLIESIIDESDQLFHFSTPNHAIDIKFLLSQKNQIEKISDKLNQSHQLLSLSDNIPNIVDPIYII